MRCDGVNPGLLGMGKVISEDALRNALKRIPEVDGTLWLDGHLCDSVAPLLEAPWILDTDTTVKPLYGHQEGAVISYNPRKPGRPSHNYHTYLMAGLRQVLGVEVRAGNEHTAKHCQPGLLKILDDLSPQKKPKLVRGDNAFGNDAMMAALEEREQPYLFKLKLSKNVKRHIGSLFRQSGWTDAGQGWEGKGGELALSGWESTRRVVVLRRALKGEVMLAAENDGQQLLAFVEADRKAGKGITGYEYAVLVTNTDYEILSLGQLYRDRADAENAFDELKNQWGWGGFTTHDLHRCQLAARAVALIYNWWSLFVRLANPQARREAITSRPWLMSSVGRRTEHAGQTTITLTGLHAHFETARAALMRVSALLQGWVAQAAEQFNPSTIWNLVCDHLKRVLAGIRPPPAHQLLENYANGVE
jgi:Transposase DDE domain group 1